MSDDDIWVPTITRAVASSLLVLSCLTGQFAAAADDQVIKDDLAVTMQIITDPEADLPDDVVRHIPLPPRDSASTTNTPKPATPDAAAQGQERAREARELGRDVSDLARQDAAEQREQVRRSMADEHRRNPGPPNSPPGQSRP